MFSNLLLNFIYTEFGWVDWSKCEATCNKKNLLSKIGKNLYRSSHRGIPFYSHTYPFLDNYYSHFCPFFWLYFLQSPVLLWVLRLRKRQAGKIQQNFTFGQRIFRNHKWNLLFVQVIIFFYVISHVTPSTYHP